MELVRMMLRRRYSATRKACGLELTRAIWPGEKDLGGYWSLKPHWIFSVTF